jgi:hypothetical protein
VSAGLGLAVSCFWAIAITRVSGSGRSLPVESDRDTAPRGATEITRQQQRPRSNRCVCRWSGTRTSASVSSIASLAPALAATPPLASAKTRLLSQSEVSGGLELVGSGLARLLRSSSHGLTPAFGRLRKPTEFALLLADGRSSTRQLAPDLLAGGCLQAPDGPVALWALACAAAGPIIALRSERTGQPGPPPLRRTELDIVAAPIRLVAAEAQPIDPGVTLGARIAPAGAIAMRAPYVRRSVACGLAIARQRRRRAVVDRLADGQLSTGGPLTCRANEGSPRSQNGCPNHRNSGSSAAR